MKRVIAAVVLMLGLAYCQTAKEGNVRRIVLPNLRGHPNPANEGHLKTGQR